MTSGGANRKLIVFAQSKELNQLSFKIFLNFNKKPKTHIEQIHLYVYNMYTIYMWAIFLSRST